MSIFCAAWLVPAIGWGFILAGGLVLVSGFRVEDRETADKAHMISASSQRSSHGDAQAIEKPSAPANS
jgi:hypothetical protein